MNHQPRKGDLSRDELEKRANQVLSMYPRGSAMIYFKFTCEHCGERCTFQKANHLFENGECHKCGKETPIKFGGFMLEVDLIEADQANEKDSDDKK